MSAPSHAAPGPTTVQRVRRFAYWVLAVDVLALAVLGIVLAFGYEPTKDALPTAHGLLGVVAVLAALVAAAATVGDAERSTVGVLPAIVVLGLVAGMYLTGPVLAWDSLNVAGPVDDPKGVTVVFDEDVVSVTKGEDVILASDYRRNAWLHVVALPIALVVMGGAGLWAFRRRRRNGYVPQRAAAVGSDQPYG